MISIDRHNLLWDVLSFVLHVALIAALVFLTPVREIVLPQKEPSPPAAAEMPPEKIEHLDEQLAEARKRELDRDIEALQTVLNDMDVVRDQLLQDFDDVANELSADMREELRKIAEEAKTLQEEALAKQDEAAAVIDKLAEEEKKDLDESAGEIQKQANHLFWNEFMEIADRQSKAQNALDRVQTTAAFAGYEKVAEAAAELRDAQIEAAKTQTEERKSTQKAANDAFQFQSAEQARSHEQWRADQARADEKTKREKSQQESEKQPVAAQKRDEAEKRRAEAEAQRNDATERRDAAKREKSAADAERQSATQRRDEANRRAAQARNDENAAKEREKRADWEAKTASDKAKKASEDMDKAAARREKAEADIKAAAEKEAAGDKNAKAAAQQAKGRREQAERDEKQARERKEQAEREAKQAGERREKAEREVANAAARKEEQTKLSAAEDEKMKKASADAKAADERAKKAESERFDAEKRMNVARAERDRFENDRRTAERREQEFAAQAESAAARAAEYEKKVQEAQKRKDEFRAAVAKIDTDAQKARQAAARKAQQDILDAMAKLVSAIETDTAVASSNAPQEFEANELSTRDVSDMSVSETYEFAKELEEAVTESYREVVAASTAITQHLPLEEAERLTDVAKPVRDEIDAELLDGRAQTAEELAMLKEARYKAAREADNMVDASMAMMDEAFRIAGAGDGGDFKNGDKRFARGLLRLKRGDLKGHGQMPRAERFIALSNLTGQMEAAAAESKGMMSKDMTALTRAGGAPVVAGRGPADNDYTHVAGKTAVAHLEGGPSSRSGDSGHPGTGEDLLPGNILSLDESGSTARPGGWMYLLSWWVIGPFPNPDRLNLTRRFPPESVVDLDAAYEGQNGLVHWRFVQARNTINRRGRSVRAEVKPAPGVPEYTIWYGWTQLVVDRECDVWLAAGSDDRSDVWVNGMKVWASGNNLKEWTINEGFRKIHLHKGANEILVRLENGHGPAGFSVCVSPHDTPPPL